MKMSDAFPSNYLRCSDLQGREHRLTMGLVKIEKLGQDEKPVLYFLGKDKGCALNKTNGSVIAEAYGDESDEWQGKEIILYPDKTQFQGQLVDCIRVRVPVPAADAADDIPF